MLQSLTVHGRYTYSLVFAADMYATIFKKDPLDPNRGKLYREKILGPGGSRDEIDSLKVCRVCAFRAAWDADHSCIALQDFLGRPPNADAFIKELFGSH